MKKLAKVRGGKCLSTVYVNAHSKLLWQCEKGHQWQATPNKIQQGRWCRKCGGNKKLTIHEMHHLAESRNGKCLSSTYINSQTNLLWECKEGHRWEATPNNIKRGEWCPLCAGNIRLRIEEFKKIAKEQGGRCLSENYVNNHTKLLWECSAGHRWEAIPNSIKRGSWCQKCAGLGKPSLQYLQQTARERGGKCLSSTYPNARAKLLWDCSEDHQWKAPWDKIRQGRWCPDCSTGLGERICREFFEQLFHRRFPKYRPEWLVNKDGNRMELDGFCKSLRLAFEHQGEQHYSTKSPFIASKTGLSKRQEDDILKRNLCRQHGIKLIQVPSIPDRLPIDQMKAFLKKECSHRSISFPHDFNSTKVSLRNAYAVPSLREILNQLHAIARMRGGKCLADRYAGDNVRLQWECREGHNWEAVPSSVKQGTWCPYCAGITKKTIQDMHRIAEQRGGKCLSKNYINSKTKLWWQCSKGHKREALPGQVVQGSWCPNCAGRRKTTRDLRLIAEARGGKCLSDKYLGARSKHLWQCRKGHKWQAMFDSVRRGSWCPFCAGQNKTIEDMHQLAKRSGGKCLSVVYHNSRTKILWECDKGHRWEAIPTSVARGSWCPVCRSTKLSIEQMQKVAQERGGKCLSSKYINASTRLLWECSAGHRWEAVPKHIKEGRWCPICGRRKKVLDGSDKSLSQGK
jgi:hypothetical protein